MDGMLTLGADRSSPWRNASGWGDGARCSTESRARIFLGPRGRARVEAQRGGSAAEMSQSPSRDGGLGGYGGGGKGTT